MRLLVFILFSFAALINAQDTSFVNLEDLSSDFVLDMKYASEDNFLKQNVYPCAECWLRKETALALIRANDSLLKRGYRIKIWDCYRPLDVQKKMWKIMPNASYVANPYKRGSMHNRGTAVDITLVYKDSGEELDMGTGFDHFGKDAHTDHSDLPPLVLKSREVLQRAMKEAGFLMIRTEWWHFSYPISPACSVSNHPLDCKE